MSDRSGLPRREPKECRSILTFGWKTCSPGVVWAIECGATEAVHQPENRDRNRLRVMLDPAGHPFCLWS